MAGKITPRPEGWGPVPVARLTEVFRQAAESQIIINAHNADLSVVSRIDIEEGEAAVVETTGMANARRARI
jgi:hypothetical protein